MVVSRCTRCGTDLQAAFRFCPSCGQAVPSAAPAPMPSLRWLPFVFAAGAVFWLIELVQFAAVVAAPAGREQLEDALRQAGLTGDITTIPILVVLLRRNTRLAYGIH